MPMRRQVAGDPSYLQDGADGREDQGMIRGLGFSAPGKRGGIDHQLPLIESLPDHEASIKTLKDGGSSASRLRARGSVWRVL